MKIWNWYLYQFENYGHFRKVAISLIFSRFFIITFDWNGNLKFWWFHWKYLVQIYQNITYFKFKIHFCIYKNQFLGENLSVFCSFFFELHQKFSTFLNSDDCFEKFTSKFNRLYPVIIQIMIRIITITMLTRSSERIFNPSCCTIYKYIYIYNKISIL